MTPALWTLAACIVAGIVLIALLLWWVTSLA